MRGHSPRGQRRAARWVDAAARLGHVATGSVYIIVGVVAALACFDARMRPLGTQGALHRTLKGDLGALALLAIALGLTADAVWQMVRAAVDADRWLNLTELPPTIRTIVMGLGRFGLVARGAVLGLAGVFLVLAAIQLRPQDAQGLGGTLRTIQYQHEGRLLLGIIALGFI